MKKLLYIGHSYHNKTKSTQFLQQILKKEYEVEKFDFDPYNNSFDIFNSLNGSVFDVVILFQIMPSINKLKEFISYKHIAFFPMYDGAGDLDSELWQEYRDVNIINFSKTLHEECKKRGFSTHYIQYFPKPKEIDNWGDEKSVFLWQRINQINPKIVDDIIGFDNINKFYYHKAPDPEHKVYEIPQEWQEKTKTSNWFETKQDLLEHIQKSALYMAPRHLEGIGMSFLEAMAMGRCIIAPNNPTMNEYILNGKTGYLYDLNNPQRLEIQNIKQIQENTIKYIEEGYKNWEDNKSLILKWINSNAKPNRLRMWNYYKRENFIENIFSIKNKYNYEGKRKIIKFLGLKLSIKQKYREG